MDPFGIIGGGVLSSGANFVSNLLGFRQNRNMYNQSMRFEKEKFNYAKDLQQQIFGREDNAVQRRAADLQAAGLSPLAEFQSAGAGAAVTAGSGVSGQGRNLGQLGDEQMIQLLMEQEQRNIQNANARKALEIQDAQAKSQVGLNNANAAVAKENAQSLQHMRKYNDWLQAQHQHYGVNPNSGLGQFTNLADAAVRRFENWQDNKIRMSLNESNSRLQYDRSHNKNKKNPYQW